MISQAEFFDSYAEKWDSMERPDICDLLDRVVRESGISAGMDILDVGTGTGVIIPCIQRATNGDCNIRAIDISAGMLAIARSKVNLPNVRFELADIEDFDCPDCSFDAIICNAVYPHFTNKSKVLSRIWSLLRPSGIIVVSHPTGREAVNKVHREASAVVTQDKVPTIEVMSFMLSAAGFTNISTTDEPEFYLAHARKPH